MFLSFYNRGFDEYKFICGSFLHPLVPDAVRVSLGSYLVQFHAVLQTDVFGILLPAGLSQLVD